MSRICPLFSGSTGNSTYISTAEGGILIDAGASYKSLCNAVEMAGGNMQELLAVAITHEHIDHIKGLKVLLKNLKIPLIASQKTLEALAAGECIPEKTTVFVADEGEKDFGNIKISRFATSHDCEGSSGYVVTLPDGKRCAVCTDLGVVTDEVRSAITGSKAVLIESNHDVNMLKNGPYPPHLKLRILSDKGHISNAACAVELTQLLQNGTTRFILGHLSQKNNLPMLALSTAKSTLMDIGAAAERDYILSVAKPCGNGVIVL
ncbi:MAG: MBL fold metallo-hydrolase [Ruminococcaceae bacterium]|nr:MBL fold metallo-hydrolase [Oscillospiraceae bacterium]